MSTDGGEGFPIGDPWVPGDARDTETLLKKETKRELVSVLEGWDAVAGEPLHPLIGAFLGVENPENIRYIPLTGVENGVPLNIDIYRSPEGNPDKPNRRWSVVMDDPQNEDFETQLFVDEIPDGWDVEYHKLRRSKDDRMNEEIAFATSDAEYIEGMYPRAETSRQQARELGMASVSDQKVKDIIKILREAEKRKSPQGE